MSKADNKKPSKYPPVTFTNFPIPPVKPEKTGSPTAPKSNQTRTERKPRFPPSRLIEKKMANVCMVNGTVVGMEIQEHIVMRAAIRPIIVMFLIFETDVVI